MKQGKGKGRIRVARQHLQDPKGLGRRILEHTSTSLIVIALGTAPLEVSSGMTALQQKAIVWTEAGILAFFTAEFALRLWIAERPWRYLFSFYGIVDLLAIVPFYLMWGTETTALRAVRLLRLIRLWKHRGYARACARLTRALHESKDEAGIFVIASALTVYVAAVGIHQFEAHAQPEHFGTLGQSLWWALGLLVDIEYGEVYPVTAGGKAFTALVALVGIAIIAVPAGMVASALTKVAQTKGQHREKEDDHARQ